MRRKGSDAGVTTVEYALCITVVVALVGVMIAVVRSDAVRAALEGIVLRALQ